LVRITVFAKDLFDISKNILVVGEAVVEWPRGFQEVKVPRFHDRMVVRLSALRTGCL